MDNKSNSINTNKSGTNKSNSSSKAKNNSFMASIGNKIGETASSVSNTVSNSVSGAVNITFGDAASRSTNLIFIISGVLVFAILILLFFFSKTARVARALDTISMYQKYQTVSSAEFMKFKKLELKKLQVASSYNSILVYNQMMDYTSEEILLATLQSGARYVEFNIFNSKFGPDAIPVVSNGYRTGEYQFTFNSVTFESCCKVISDHAFKQKVNDEGVPNHKDPLFIGLNLNTNNNIHCLDIMANIIMDYFKDRLLDHIYSFQQSNIADIKLKDLKQKIVIFSSSGFEGSNMEELINASWDAKMMQRIHYSDLLMPNFNRDKLVAFNKKGITIVVPHMEGDFYTENYDFNEAHKAGCQFVCMNYQYVDANIDRYITKFKERCIMPKPRKLR
tara:strand:- start:243 stop:1418 length:1176 start_codon:yes stop_codon:yes gene_type:complete